MAVQSRDMAPTTPPRRGLLAPPIDRKNLDQAAPWLRLLAGVALIAISSYSTVTGVAKDAAPLELPMVAGIAGGMVSGVLVALFLSVGEWLTSEQAPYIYAVFLILDAWYTQRQCAEAVNRLALHHIGDATLAPIVAFVLSWLLAIAIARFGEILLFGKRR